MKGYTVTCQVEVSVQSGSKEEAINKAHLELTFGTDVSDVKFIDCKEDKA